MPAAIWYRCEHGHVFYSHNPTRLNTCAYGRCDAAVQPYKREPSKKAEAS
jgi:hypothetical protein